MGKNNSRPVSLNLFKIHLPIGGWVSILHRITGVLLVLLLPLALYMMQRSLHDPTFFKEIAARLASTSGHTALLVVLWVFAQHFFSGLRHLLQDVGIGIEKAAARRAAWITFLASGIVVLLAGVCR